MQHHAIKTQPLDFPPDVARFKTLINELKEKGKPEEAMKYYIDNLSKYTDSYPEEYKIKSNVSLIVKKLEPYIDTYLKDPNKMKLLFNFLECSLKCFKSSKETTKIFFIITMKTAEFDDPDILQYSSQYFQSLLANAVIFSYMFTQSRLADVFQNCFCFYPNTRLFYGPIILSETSNRVFTKIANLTEFMDKVKVLLHDGNIEPKSSNYAFTFIGYIIRSLDTGSFLPDILPYIIEFAPLCDNLSYFQFFLQAPNSKPNSVWSALKSITNDTNMSCEAMNSVLLAIEQSQKVPPSKKYFSFRPYIPLFEKLTKDQQTILYEIILRCPVDIIADFIVGAAPLSKTKIDPNFILTLCQTVRFESSLQDLWTGFILKQGVDEFVNGDDSIFHISQAILNQMDDTRRPDNEIIEFFLNVSLIKWNDAIASVIDLLLINLKVKSYISVIISFLMKDDLPDDVLNFISEYLPNDKFASSFIENNGQITFETLMKKESGRDFIAKLAYTRPNKVINKFFFNNPPNDLSEKEIDLLMHGLPHNSQDINEGYLCIPSLIPLVSSYKLKTPLENYIVGSAVGKFFSPLKAHFKRFLSTYISSTILRYQIADPEFLPYITDPIYPHFNVLQSTPISIKKPSKFRRPVSFCFWFNIFELKGQPTVVVTINETTLSLDENGYAHIGNDTMFCPPHDWHSVAIITTSDGLASFYIDKRLMSTVKTNPSETPFFSFGNSGLNSMIYFISPYLKSSTSLLTMDQIEQFHLSGPNSPTNVIIEPTNGLHYVVSDGLPKYLSTVGGPFFVFDVAMITNTLPQFLNCLEAAFNLLELGFFEKESFISSLRFILRQKNRYEDSVIQLLRDRILNYFEIHDVCLFLNDFVVLSTKAENLIRIAPLDMSSTNCNSHFFYVIEEFCFFEFDDEVQDSLLDVIKYFIEFDDYYLRIIPIYAFALPNIDTKTPASVDDSRQYKKQIKLIQTFFNCLNTIPSTLTTEDVISAMAMLNPTVGSEFFYLLCKRIVENDLFSESEMLFKIDAFIASISKFEKTWVSLFNLLTDQFEFKTIDELNDHQEELSIVHEEFIDVIFKLVTNTFLRNNHAYLSLQLVVDLMNSSEIPLESHLKSIQYLCTLGFAQRSIHKSTSVGDALTKLFPTSKSMTLSTSMNNLHNADKKESKRLTKLEALSVRLFTDNYQPKRKIPPKPLKNSSPYSNSGNSSLKSKHYPLLQPTNSSSSISNDNLIYEEYFDPNLTQMLTTFINSRKVNDSDITNPDLDIPSPSELKNDLFQSNKTIKYIIETVVELLTQSIDEYTKFNSYLISFSLLPNDVDQEIATKFHQYVILQLLDEEKLANNKKVLDDFLLFLAYRIYEGWWGPEYNTTNEKEKEEEEEEDNSNPLLVPLFETVLPLLEKDTLCTKYFIFAVFTCASKFGKKSASLISTLSEEFKGSKFYKVFQNNPDDFMAYLMLIGENSDDQKSKEILELFHNSANKNILAVSKERNNAPYSNSFELECLYLYKRQIAVSTNFRKMARYQFFWHLNTSAMYIDKAISNIHLQRLKHRFTYGIPAKFLVSYSSSPICVPKKLLPRIFSYDNRCQKMAKLIDIPRSYHTPYLKSFLHELNKVFSAPYCFAGWKLPCFVNVHFQEFVKEAFNGIPNINPFEAQILGTPEACQCVIVLSEKAINFILNCDLLGQTPSSENLCHYPLYEEAMAGYFGTPSIFFGKPAFSIPLSQITMVFPRRYLHSAIALDFFTITGTQISLVVSLTYRNLLINYLRPRYNKIAKTGPLYWKQLLMKQPTEVAKKWARGSISSFTYLLYLNYVGNRAFTDYSQYPVFPWVASDYDSAEFPPSLRDLSKPLGQLTESRREKFERIFYETDHQYFYGTHYSNPAGVLHFMMRAEPFTIFNVVLHTGFDHRDRLFSSLSETWRTCSERNTTDLKELIPQFFCFPSMFENINKLQLQTRSDGTDINSVKLPPWGPSPVSFVKRHRQLLESNLLSKTLPHWIDLVFGYKQRGQAAVEAKNLFLPISYDVDGAKNDFFSSNDASQINESSSNLLLADDDDDSDDFASSTNNLDNQDEALNAAEIDTILNFGQCPLQVLTTPHVQRTTQKYANLENSATRHVIIHRNNEEKNSQQTSGSNSEVSLPSTLPNKMMIQNLSCIPSNNRPLMKQFITNDVGYDIHSDSDDSLDYDDDYDNEEEEEDNNNNNKCDESFAHKHHISKSLRDRLDPATIKWRIAYEPSIHKLKYTHGLNWQVSGKLNLTVSERRIHFHSQRINSDTLIDIVDAVLSRDQTLLTIITSFGKIDTYSVLYNHLEPISTSFLPDIIPLVAVDVSSHFSMIVVASESYIAVVDLGTGFLLSKLHHSFDKVAFDETHESIIASSAETNEVSVFSLNLHFICSAKYSLKNTMNFKKTKPKKDQQKQKDNEHLSCNEKKFLDEITTIATSDSNNWDCTPYFVTGHRNGAVNIWHVDTTPSNENLKLFTSEMYANKNMSVNKEHIMTCKTLCMAENPIDSIVIFSRGRALAYIDRKGTVGVISICMKNRSNKKILKNSCFKTCTSCELGFKQGSSTMGAANTGLTSNIFIGSNSSLPKAALNFAINLVIGSNPNSKASVKHKNKESDDDSQSNVIICSSCGLPCCKRCITKGSICPKCQEIANKCNGNFIVDDLDGNSF